MITGKKILVLSPHTDDVEFAMGGTIARLIEEGSDVHIKAFSDCEDSIKELGLPYGTLVRECTKAMEVLQPSTYSIRGFNVRRFAEIRHELLQILVKGKKSYMPDVVFCPASTDVHQDHQVIHQEAVRAFRNSATILGYEVLRNHIGFSNRCYVALEWRHMNKKWQTLSCYESQLKYRPEYFNQHTVESLARVRGAEIGKEFAECFEPIKIQI